MRIMLAVLIVVGAVAFRLLLFVVQAATPGTPRGWIPERWRSWLLGEHQRNHHA